MAKQSNKRTRELKQLEAKEIDPSLLHSRELRGWSVNKESCTPTGPNHKQSITDDPAIVTNLPPPINQSTPERN